MEAFPAGAWELDRPNITTWTPVLESALRSTRGLVSAKEKIVELGNRINLINQTTLYDDEEASGEEPNDWGKAVGDSQDVEEPEDAEPEIEEPLLNEPPVLFLFPFSAFF
jgi:hypothetical protein